LYRVFVFQDKIEALIRQNIKSKSVLATGFMLSGKT